MPEKDFLDFLLMVCNYARYKKLIKSFVPNPFAREQRGAWQAPCLRDHPRKHCEYQR